MAVLFFVVVINALLGLFVFARNKNSKANVLFLLLVINICLWAIASYLTDNGSTETIRLLAAKAAFVFPVVFSATLAVFSATFPVTLTIGKRWFTVLWATTVFGISISISNLVVAGVTIRPGGTDIVPGLLYNAYTVVVLVLFGFAARSYIKSRRRADTMQRNQVRIMGLGLMISFFWALVFGVLLPLFVKTWVPGKFGPAGTVFFVGATAYAIVRHKLFDVRLVVARSLAYTFSILFLAVIYGGLAFGVSSSLTSSSQSLSVQQEAFYIVLAVVMAFVFPYIKRFFDHSTNALFYRDAYEPQTLIDELNKVLVGDIMLESMLTKSSQVIGSTLKASYCFFGIKENQANPQRIIGTHMSIAAHDIEEVRQLTPQLHHQVIITDELDEHDKELRDILRKNNIEVLVRLTDKPTKNIEGIGYMVLGTKKSGNPYSSQDAKMLEIIAGELVIAVQNALHFEEIQNFASTLQEKVDDATHKLRKTNEKLRQLDETKDDFISMASHQLRTPLTSVKGYVSMVLDGDAGKISKQQEKLLQQAFISSQRMVYLIADLLNVSRLKTGKFVIEAKPTNLIDVVESELEQLTETAKGRGLSLDFVKPKSVPLLNLDETKVRQVIMNFTDNAIYYTPSGGTITVNLIDKPDAVELTVVDNGIGVPKDEQHHLFTKFYRAGNAKKARPDGTGLGLFMAQKVVIAQGGAIIFHSEEHKGSTFGFSFPKNKLVVEGAKSSAETAEKPQA